MIEFHLYFNHVKWSSSIYIYIYIYSVVVRLEVLTCNPEAPGSSLPL